MKTKIIYVTNVKICCVNDNDIDIENIPIAEPIAELNTDNGNLAVTNAVLQEQEQEQGQGQERIGRGTRLILFGPIQIRISPFFNHICNHIRCSIITMTITFVIVLTYITVKAYDIKNHY